MVSAMRLAPGKFGEALLDALGVDDPSPEVQAAAIHFGRFILGVSAFLGSLEKR